MKKNKLLHVVVFICVAFFGWILFSSPAFFRPATPSDDTKTVQVQKPSISVILNTGDSVLTYDAVTAETVFEALNAVCSENAIVLEKKQYDFGVFIEKIGDKANTKDKAWIYYINGKSGEVAADKQTLTNGDTIEWRYEKPLF